jgi:hypothetical protein
MLEVSRDAAAAGKEQLVSFAAEQSKYCSICTATLGPCGDLPFTSWSRWQCLRCGACGDMLEAMTRLAPSQPNLLMARIAPRRIVTIPLDQSCRVNIPKKIQWT